jgi:hypothetical protein
VRKRKPLAATGYGSAGIGRIFLYFAASWGGILAGRVVDRFGKGIRFPKSRLRKRNTERDIS